MKTIASILKELQTFGDKTLPIYLSEPNGDTLYPISHIDKGAESCIVFGDICFPLHEVSLFSAHSLTILQLMRELAEFPEHFDVCSMLKGSGEIRAISLIAKGFEDGNTFACLYVDNSQIYQQQHGSAVID